MKAKIHPEYKDCVIKCSCGAEYKTKSLNETSEVEICSACHPFFTGQQKFIDAAGRIEKFKQKYNIK